MYSIICGCEICFVETVILNPLVPLTVSACDPPRPHKLSHLAGSVLQLETVNKNSNLDSMENCAAGSQGERASPQTRESLLQHHFTTHSADQNWGERGENGF